MQQEDTGEVENRVEGVSKAGPSMPKNEALPSTSARLWLDCQLEAMRSLHHPWTLGLADGSVSRESFKGYVAQDAYFLEAFVQGYGFALTKAKDIEGIRSFHSLIGSVLEELELHATYATKWGVDIHNLTSPMEATQQYVGFLHRVTSDPLSSVSEILASMAPCMRLYAFLGKELRKAFPRWRESPYAEWVETYSSSGFESAAALVDNLLDKYSTPEEYPTLLKLYRKARAGAEAAPGMASRTNHTERRAGAAIVGAAVEAPMAEAQVGGGSEAGFHRMVGLLCVDFDDTCTDGDTTSLLPQMARDQGEKRGFSEAGQGQALDKEWEGLTVSFLEKYNKVLQKGLNASETRRQQWASQREGGGGEGEQEGSERFDPEGLEDMLRDLQQVELDSVAMVSRSQVLRGVTRESIRSLVAGEMRPMWAVRPGLAPCLRRAMGSPLLATHVLSINWSRDVIVGVLGDTLRGQAGPVSDESGGAAAAPVTLTVARDLEGSDEEGGQHRPEQGHHSAGGDDSPPPPAPLLLPVWSNDLAYDAEGMSTGEVVVAVSGALGKRQRFRELKERQGLLVSNGQPQTSPEPGQGRVASSTGDGGTAAESGGAGGGRRLTVFVGDSVTDMLAMLDADVGIVVGNSRTFRRVAGAFGVAVLPLASAHLAAGEAMGIQGAG
ncbi:unnamed protein product, partial [Discosporangium mesarthrocarpum]